MPRFDAKAAPGVCVLICAAIAIQLVALLAPGVAFARANIRAAFFVIYPGAVGSRLDNLPSITGHCGICHYRFSGGGTRNPYGIAVGNALPGYPNTDAGRQAVILSLDGIDQDADGYITNVEVTDLANYSNTPTFPGLTASNVGLISNVDPADVLPYLTPTAAMDVTPPSVTVLSPNGGQSYNAESTQLVTWTATDASGIASIDIYLSDDGGLTFRAMLVAEPHDGEQALFIPNYPGIENRIIVSALDNAGNRGFDASDGDFTIVATPPGLVPTTLRDVELAGSQPHDARIFGDADAECASCHGNYDTNVEPWFNWRGGMMAQAMRDPLYLACLAIAEQDAPSVGDLCLRCHSPAGWLSGRSFDTGGGMITAHDRQSVQCNFCHRMVDPDYKPGTSPPEDEAILAALIAIPYVSANGEFVVDPAQSRRGPYDDAVAQHPVTVSPFHRSASLCGTCHDVSNPVYVKGAGDNEYAPTDFDAAHPDLDLRNQFPIERTFSEWTQSEYAATGVYAPQFAGNKPDGIVSTCQDCHMRDVAGAGANVEGTPVRQDLPLHDQMGGNHFIPDVLPHFFPAEVDVAQLQAAKQRAIDMLQKAATMTLEAAVVGVNPTVRVAIMNETAHKLPSGYPEGRRIWLNVRAYDESDALVYESGAYDASTGILTHDADAKIYEIKPGISSRLGAIVGQPAGPSFHFAVNDTIFYDNRIPPRGFTNAAFAAIQSPPIAYSYEDGSYTDVTEYTLPPEAVFIRATLYYQSTSKEYVEFLRDENVTNSAGDDLYAAWVAQGRAAPVAMVTDTIRITPTGVEPRPQFVYALHAAYPNPFNPVTRLDFELAARGRIWINIYDASGRLVRALVDETKSAGRHTAFWDGANNAGTRVASGVYFFKMKSGGFEQVRKVVMLR
jgi:cytochrome c553